MKKENIEAQNSKCHNDHATNSSFLLQEKGISFLDQQVG